MLKVFGYGGAILGIVCCAPVLAQGATRIERYSFFNNIEAYISSDAKFVNRPQHVFVGDTLYASTNYVALAQVIIDEDRVIETENGTVSVNKGETLKGHLQDYIALNSWFETSDRKFVRDGKPRSRACFMDTDGNGTLDTVETTNAFAKVFTLADPIPYHFVTYMAKADTSWSLSYLGSSGGSVKLAYREQMGDIARPAFANDLTFPATVGQTSVVRFKYLQMALTPLADGSLDVIVTRILK